MIVYVHGFNSGVGGTTFTTLQERFRRINLPVVGITHSYNPDEAIDELCTFVEDCMEETNGPLLIVGSSLGGFYARFIGNKYKLPVVLVNPALDPCKSLTKYVGEVTNHSTGVTHTFPQEYVDAFKKFYVSEDGGVPLQADVVVALDDDVIDPQKAIDEFTGKVAVHVFENGGHRFEAGSSAMEELIKIIFSAHNTFIL
jgi:uncharacterized protein